MIKPTPNPPKPNPEFDPTAAGEAPDPKKFHEAANRALDYYLTPADLQLPASNDPEPIFIANPNQTSETLLVKASENLGSASLMLCNFADTLCLTDRKTLLGITQVVMCAELAVSRALDRIEVR